MIIHDISRAGKVLLTADKSRVALFALPPGETHERALSWFDWSLLADISPDGKTVIFSETGEAVGANYSMFMRKTDGSPAIRLGGGGFGKLSPDGKWVVAEDGAPAKVMEYDAPDPHAQKIRPRPPGTYRTLVFNRWDGTFVVWLKAESKGYACFGSSWAGQGPYGRYY